MPALVPTVAAGFLQRLGDEPVLCFLELGAGWTLRTAIRSGPATKEVSKQPLGCVCVCVCVWIAALRGDQCQESSTWRYLAFRERRGGG